MSTQNARRRTDASPLLVWLRTIDGTDSADPIVDFEAMLESIRFRDQ